MHHACPVCGTWFERGEQGYFVGAMYVAFALSLPPYLALFFTLLRYTDWSSEGLVLGAGAAMLPLVPMIYRYSRVVWVHLDRYLDPVKGTR
jgi:hypothetical protein